MIVETEGFQSISVKMNMVEAVTVRNTVVIPFGDIQVFGKHKIMILRQIFTTKSSFCDISDINKESTL